MEDGASARRAPRGSLDFVKNYLDKHFDSLESLEKASSLLQETRNQHSALLDKQKQLEDALPGAMRSSQEIGANGLKSLENLETKRKKVSEGLDVQLASSSGHLRSILSGLSSQINKLQQAHSYITLVLQIDHLSERIESLLAEQSGKEIVLASETAQKAVDYYLQLETIKTGLQNKHCDSLKSLVQSKVDQLGSTLESALKKAFTTTFEAILWPALPSWTTPLDPPAIDAKALQRFQNLLSQLLLLQISNRTETAHAKQLGQLWAIHLLLKPLVKRFYYHFMTNKSTNRLDKPEWFFTDVREVIKLNCPFLEEHVQPILDKEGLSCYDAKLEFMAGMVTVAKGKLALELEHILANEEIWCHAINETLEFHKALHDFHDYRHDELVYSTYSQLPHCMQVFTEDAQVFEKWLQMELKFATEHLKDAVNLPLAWEFLYPEEQRQHPLKPTHSADALTSLLASVTERYEALPQQSHRLEFLTKVQKDLLKQYLHKTKELFSQEEMNLLSHHFQRTCMFINSLKYCQAGLKDWGEQLLFLELQSFAQKQRNDITESDDEEMKTDKRIERKEDVNISRTIFDDVATTYQKLRYDMLGSIRNIVVRSFKDNSHQYLGVKYVLSFLLIPSDMASFGRIWKGEQHVDSDLYDISSEVCSALVVLKRDMHLLKKSLSGPVFAKLWMAVAHDLNEYFFRHLISRDHTFLPAGALQLRKDVEALFLIFKEFTDKPKNYFKELKEAVVVLALKETDRRAVEVMVADGDVLPSNNLALQLSKFGIHKLQPRHIALLLSSIIRDSAQNFGSKF